MSSTTDTAVGAAAGTDRVVDLRGMWIGLIVLNIFYLIVRVYEQVYGWRAVSTRSRRNSRHTG